MTCEETTFRRCVVLRACKVFAYNYKLYRERESDSECVRRRGLYYNCTFEDRKSTPPSYNCVFVTFENFVTMAHSHLITDHLRTFAWLACFLFVLLASVCAKASMIQD
jgi:hypothetical protein